MPEKPASSASATKTAPVLCWPSPSLHSSDFGCPSLHRATRNQSDQQAVEEVCFSLVSLRNLLKTLVFNPGKNTIKKKMPSVFGVLNIEPLSTCRR